ncbi:tRNA (cytosine-5-)-methyltransferase [Schizosaccharomyces japonicus yFS275]|uniref:tRNA (Cytosine-5-)-methyltransferase n=1 Tax=Schizosaccharomyces japonicus (strain yFS275 / FY16936) TaxID=402676 RepID=B6JVB8_SCHJY|nr:tRNA (cytosine-5-)-methyltransferase [Schizosaccharomyces japonicus yFS275]EEB05319.2 tRNA (cytosine-5-)-methyltransferase [Schizosaccharomyces japonicus yFS275]
MFEPIHSVVCKPLTNRSQRLSFNFFGRIGIMGRKKGGRRGNRKPKAFIDWDTIPRENENFEKYYKTQALLPENEWTQLLETLKITLPTTFRITETNKHARRVRDLFVNHYCPMVNGCEYEGQKIPIPTEIPWYPGKLAFTINIPKSVIRKTPALKPLQKFLMYETECGDISRQEAVSMIPPLFLDVKPHHKVLDMCAAPGSKTAQLIEALHRDSNVESPEKDIVPSGLVIANDADSRRAHMLVHQIKRLNSPNVVITNHDASYMPNFHMMTEGKTGEAKRVNLKFDRILADVPCSGDGTFRKNISLWKEWTLKTALGLHATQVKILLRGLQMLATGGRLVYSTCSMNPIENEAVVSAILKATEGSVRLVDTSKELPSLVRNPGVFDWKVMDGDLNEYKSFEELPSNLIQRMPKTLWPLPKSELERLHIERCMRVYPHQQNTGGFFVAVLEKYNDLEGTMQTIVDENKAISRGLKRCISPKKEEEVKKPCPDSVAHTQKETTKEDESQKQDAVQSRGNGNRFQEIDPFSYVSEDNEELKKIFSFFKVNDKKMHRDLFLVRNPNGVPTGALYYSNNLLKQIITNNRNHIKFVHGGVKVFVRQEFGSQTKEVAEKTDACYYRIQSDGAFLAATAMDPSSVTNIPSSDLRVLLDNETVTKESFPEDSTLGKVYESLPLGCSLLRADLKNEEHAIQEEVYICLWKSFRISNVMMAKSEKQNILLQLNGSVAAAEDKSVEEAPKSEA